MWLWCLRRRGCFPARGISNALATLPLLQAKTFESRTAHTVGLSVCAALLVVFTWGYTIAIAVL